VGELNLPVVIREQESLRTLQDTEFPALKTRRVFTRANPAPAGLHADHRDF
jgi:hypothetical protein